MPKKQTELLGPKKAISKTKQQKKSLLDLLIYNPPVDYNYYKGPVSGRRYFDPSRLGHNTGARVHAFNDPRHNVPVSAYAPPDYAGAQGPAVPNTMYIDPNDPSAASHELGHAGFHGMTPQELARWQQLRGLVSSPSWDDNEAFANTVYTSIHRPEQLPTVVLDFIRKIRGPKS